MSSFDYAAPAELFFPVRAGPRHAPLTFRRFDTSAEAIKYAQEVLALDVRNRAVMEINEVRFDAAIIEELYASDVFPLPKRPKAAG